MKMMQLKYFKTIAETGTMAGAARALGVTPPALSIAISNLEKELGVTLFEHSCNRIVLNDAGICYLQMVDRVFKDISDTEAVLRGGGATPCAVDKP